jgi:hypothetical protein
MIVATDTLVEASLNQTRTWLSAAGSLFLRLYCNDVRTDLPTDNPADFVEASYANYVPRGILGSFGAAVRDSAGVWRCRSGVWTFPVNGNTAAFRIVGWHVTRGTKVVMYEPFLAPVDIPPGVIGPALLIDLGQGAQVVVCPESAD